nr:tripartite tricarboxylate transporter TctB family protein [uncultured Fusobacterium sp.]
MLEKIFLVFLNLISIFLFFITFTFETLEMDKYSLGATFFPRLICIILFILSLILLIFSIIKKENKNKKIGSTKIKYTVSTILFFFIYVFLLDKLGYLVSTIVFMISLLFLLKSKSILINIIFSVLFSGVIYFMFSKGFNVSLPEGIFI